MSEEGGDESPARLRRKIKKVVVLSATSESDSDESVGAAGTRRKRLRVISDEEASDSSGSSVVCSGTRRRRTLPKLRDSDADSDSSGRAQPGKANVSKAKANSGFASDSSEGNSDKCSICLLRFTSQEIGTPENCEHIFCLDCIIEWSKNINTCPVDRLTFNSIIVRTCVGGRVLRTEAVRVVQRTSSVEALVVEDPTLCELCGSMESEETMLLCDGCDLGFHMHCLNPPLSEVPAEQWLCPNCYVDINDEQELLDTINLSEVEDLFDGMIEFDLPTGPRPTASRQQRNVRRSSRNIAPSEQPSSSRINLSSNTNEPPTTSHGGRSSAGTGSRATNRRRTTTRRRKYKRRRTKTVIIEYEVQENGKFPITKKIKRRVKKRRVKRRQPRTAARRSYVRASVQAKLASQRLQRREASAAGGAGAPLSVRRHRAGIPSLSLMGDPNELDYFTDEDNAISEDASTAVAARPAANIFSAYRQARRKIVAIPSPSHASSAPDLLSDILESQTLLYSKNSLVSVTVDGNINIKLQTQKRSGRRESLVDLSKAEESARCAPSYPGQGRGGGWAGGYRGGHSRDRHHADGGFGRGAGYGAGHPGRPSGYGNYHNGGMRRDEPDYYDAFPRRPPQYANADDSYYERARRPPADGPRGGFADHHRADGRYGGPAPYARHSFGGFENPVDMRMSHTPQLNATIDSHPPAAAPPPPPPPPPVQDEPRPASRHSPQCSPTQCSPTQRSSTQSSPTQQASTFGYQKTSEVEKSEDERSDPGLVIDTDKYDPTEPTRDDDSGDEEPQRDPPGGQAGSADAPPAVLDSVRRALEQRGAAIASPAADATRGESDDDSDGDCPNFSIYSAASVHIANYGSVLPDEPPPEPGAPAAGLGDGLEDLVQEDGDDSPAASPTASRATSRAPSPAPSPAAEISSPLRPDASRPPATRSHYATPESNEKKKSEEDYKEKVSKRCPITTNTRNPIKIKLNTPSLIKRHVSLYDEEETSQDAAPEEKSAVNTKLRENRSRVKNESPKGERFNTSVTKNKDIAASEGDSKQSGGSSEARERRSVEEKSSLSLKEKGGPDNGLSNDAKECMMSADEESNAKIFDESTRDSECMSDSERHEDENVDDLLSKELGMDSPKDDECRRRADDNLEKMTESISETEDERSYTPCLDENKPNRDASFETERDKGLDGLDTEMISEEEGNEMFSENERAPSEGSRTSPAAAGAEPGGGRDEKRDGKKTTVREENVKKKKKKDSKKESKDKDKGKVKKRAEIAFKKLSKSGKERNYRERDRDEKKTERDRRDSGDKDARQRRRREKRKDLQRYDVRSVVTEKRRRLKDPFGRDVSPRERSPSLSPPERSASSAPRSRREPSRSRRSLSRTRRSPSKARRSRSRPRRSFSRARGSPTEPRGSPSRARRSTSRGRRSPSAPRRTTSRSRRSPALRKSSPAAARLRRSAPRRSPSPRAPARRSPARRKRRQSVSRPARRRSASASPPRRTLKKKKRDRSTRRAPAAISPERKRHRSASVRPEPAPPSPEPRPPSPRTPSPEPAPEEAPERPERRPRRRARDAPGGACKEVFTSGDNILVSVSFKDQERGEEIERRRRRDSRRERRRRRRAAVPPEVEVAKPVAIIDLERSPFRELTPSPKNVIVLSDSDHGERSAGERAAPDGASTAEAPPLGPKTPPEPAAPEQAAPAPPERTSPEPESRSPDAYDPFEPTRSASPASPSSPAAPEPPSAPGAAPSPPRTLITLEAAQRSNLSADEVLDRRPLSPVEKVMALLQSTRDASPEPPPGVPEPPPAPRIVLPSPTRAPPKLFPGKPSPIRSNPVKPMRAARLPRPAPPPPPEAGSSPYSPGSSDFGELFEPPPRRPRGPPRDHRRGKAQAAARVDDDSLLMLDELPSSAVAMQVKNKYLKKLNRQERVVEEVKLVLKPHYNKKRVTKEEYKDILRRAVPKICHNKSGEINPTKIQALVEAYVKKFRKRHKLGVVS